MSGKKDNLVVFDWNGTLLADTSACIKATNTVLKKLGLSTISRADYQKHYTMPLQNLYHALGVAPAMLTKHEKDINAVWHATYSTANIRLRRGAKAMLQTVNKMPCSSVILSNYVVERIEQQAGHFGIREHFDDIIAFHALDATFRRCGKGERLENYLRTRPAHAKVIVGDTEEEVDIGRALGLATIAITDGMCSPSRLRAMKPDFIVRALDQIPSIIARVFGGGKKAA
jgi:phosphoglycolate phosphatase-like HAD superfamily hydrolase